MSGKDYLLYISADGTSSGTKTEVEHQGDLEISFGKSHNKIKYKNSVKTSVDSEGIGATCTIGDEAPMPAGHVLLWDAHDNDGDCYLWIESVKTGGQKWEGDFKLSIDSKSTPTEGDVSQSVTISENGAITRGVVT